jgi:hypothetical protein
MSIAIWRFNNHNGGLLVQNMWVNIERISIWTLDIVVLDIGTNDLSAAACCPGELADAVYQFADHLVSKLGVKYVRYVVVSLSPIGRARITTPKCTRNILPLNLCVETAIYVRPLPLFHVNFQRHVISCHKIGRSLPLNVNVVMWRTHDDPRDSCKSMTCYYISHTC